MVGGLMWVVKGGSILLTGQQPPVVFEAAMPLFAVGLLGLHARLDGRGGLLGKAGVLIARGLGLGRSRVDGTARTLLRHGGIRAFPRFGVTGERHPTSQRLSPALERPATRYGAGGPLLILAGGGLALMSERLLEIPIVLIGLAWMLLGYSVLVVKGATVQAPIRVR